jgi:hypothetical protein
MQHRKQSLLPGGKLGESRRVWTLQHLLQEPKPLEVVDVKHATDCPAQCVVDWSGRPLVKASRAPQRRPAASANAVNIFELHPRLIQKRPQTHIADVAEFGDETTPIDPQGAPDVLQHGLSCISIKLNVAPGRERREAAFNLLDDTASTNALYPLYP